VFTGACDTVRIVTRRDAGAGAGVCNAVSVFCGSDATDKVSVSQAEGVPLPVFIGACDAMRVVTRGDAGSGTGACDAVRIVTRGAACGSTSACDSVRIVTRGDAGSSTGSRDTVRVARGGEIISEGAAETCEDVATGAGAATFGGAVTPTVGITRCRPKAVPVEHPTLALVEVPCENIRRAGIVARNELPCAVAAG